ncbi:MAG TPA: hypothetical protein VD790_12020 [Thermoleophilaceae bacterium]|nr:hypothetical protein [Thermoleophilaceae bacterium]
MRALPPLLVLLALAAPAVAGDSTRAPAKRLLSYGDSFAIGTKPYLPDELSRWRIRSDGEPNRHTPDAAADLRDRGKRLAPVVHLSLGTNDDPGQPKRFRRAVRRAMRAVGRERCVVWANVFRPHREGDPPWRVLNGILDEEAAARDNLVIVDWFSMVDEHREWLDKHDATHVSEEGYRHRARAVAVAARECRRRLASQARTRGSA